MFRLLILATVVLSHFCWAKDSTRIFVQHEFNDSDRISSIGISQSITQANNKVYGELLASLGYAEVQDNNQMFQHFVISDIGVRLGYYDRLYVYVEAGIDLFEVLFQSYRDQNDFEYDDSSQNAPDGYAALGAGLDTGKFRIGGFIKARKLDSDYWSSEHSVFYGLQFSLSF
jgi:hypothetical protein